MNITMLLFLGLVANNVSASEGLSTSVEAGQDATGQGNLTVGAGMSAENAKSHAERAARQLLETLGPQQTFAMLGWQVNPDYMPMQHCFDYWHDVNESELQPQDIEHCEQHVKDLSRLYASYGIDVQPVAFKSKYYWDQKTQFDLVWPELVDHWKAAGGSKEDASYLKHPGCATPLQQGWTGSDFFYDGRENPICRAHKIELIESSQK